MFDGSKNIVALTLFILTLVATVLTSYLKCSWYLSVSVVVIGTLLSRSPRIILEWERGVLLRLGHFRRVLHPGIVWVIPGVEIVSSIVDMRIRSTSFSAEKTLTRDTVPVDVDAVLFWVVTDAKWAILEVQEYNQIIDRLAQTTLRDIIGRSDLHDMISNREELDKELLNVIDARTSEWGITVQSVYIRDVNIPNMLEDSMSRKAQADREKDARIVLSQSELEVAKQMRQAAEIYSEDTVSLQLRMMNMTYESIKEKGALMVIPTNLAESLSGQVMGMAAAGFRTIPSPEQGTST